MTAWSVLLISTAKAVIGTGIVGAARQTIRRYFFCSRTNRKGWSAWGDEVGKFGAAGAAEIDALWDEAKSAALAAAKAKGAHRDR